MRLLDNALSAGKQDMPRGGTENNIAINTIRRTTGRIKFCFIRHVQWLTRTIKTNSSEHSDLSMDDVTQLFPQLSVGRRFAFPTYEICVWRAGVLSMVFKLAKSAENHWRVLRGSELIAKVITGIQFKDGIEVQSSAHRKIAA